MDKISSIKNFLIAIYDIIKAVLIYIYRLLVRVWLWIYTRVPFMAVITQRHAKNPASLFMDMASFILTIYLIFGIVAFVDIYPRKSESNFAIFLASIYPLPAGRVNTSFIWDHKFLQRVHFLNTFNEKKPTDTTSTQKPPTASELRQRVMEGLIENKIVLLEAQKLGINVSPDELQTSLETQRKGQCYNENPDKTKTIRDCTVKEFNDKIKELYDMTPNQFEEVVAELLLKEKLKNSTISRIRLRYIFTATEALAKEAKDAINSGTDFAQVAKEYSQDAKTKDQGGDVGYWYRGELAKELAPSVEEAAFKLTTNQVSDPIVTDKGVFVLQVTEKSGEGNLTYDDWLVEKKTHYTIKKYIPL